MFHACTISRLCKINWGGIDFQAAKLYTNDDTTTAKPNLANGSPVTYLTCINYSAESRDVTANSSGLPTSSDHPVAWSLHGTCLISLPKRTLLDFSVKGCGDPAIVCKFKRTMHRNGEAAKREVKLLNAPRTYKYMDNGPPIKSADRSEADNPSC